jgi:hypothetical protein
MTNCRSLAPTVEVLEPTIVDVTPRAFHYDPDNRIAIRMDMQLTALAVQDACGFFPLNGEGRKQLETLAGLRAAKVKHYPTPAALARVRRREELVASHACFHCNARNYCCASAARLVRQ